jgi:hypothetical protein|tara:strand:+ start:542 stop:931 length:390 start_codon:yes stop_codon:yes gene_type:complete
MAKKISISEEQLTNVIKNIINEQINDDEVIVGIDDEDFDIEDEEEEEEVEQILSPDEIVGLMEDQIIQLQDRVQYLEELQADVLEFVEYLMNDLEKTDVASSLRKSKQKLRALQGRAGREIFWLKSRRL